MNDLASPGRLRFFPVLLALAACVLASCATKPSVDWNDRIGNFTYDQAIAELGPPDKQSKLPDGKTVAVWTRHPGGSNRSAGVSPSSGGSVRVLRLTFDAEGKLAACSKNY